MFSISLYCDSDSSKCREKIRLIATAADSPHSMALTPAREFKSYLRNEPDEIGRRSCDPADSSAKLDPEKSIDQRIINR